MTDFDLSTVAPRLAAAHRERQAEFRVEAMARFGKSMREFAEAHRRMGERLAATVAGLDAEELER